MSHLEFVHIRAWYKVSLYENSSMMSNHNFPGYLCCNDMEDMNSSVWKAPITGQHWHLNCRTELIWNALRRRMRDTAFLLKCCSQIAAHKYYKCIIYIVFLALFLLSQLYTIVKVRWNCLLYCTVYTDFYLHYVSNTCPVLQWLWNASDW